MRLQLFREDSEEEVFTYLFNFKFLVLTVIVLYALILYDHQDVEIGCCSVCFEECTSVLEEEYVEVWCLPPVQDVICYLGYETDCFLLEGYSIRLFVN